MHLTVTTSRFSRLRIHKTSTGKPFDKTSSHYGEVQNVTPHMSHTPQCHLLRHFRPCSGKRPVFLRLSPASCFSSSRRKRRFVVAVKTQSRTEGRQLAWWLVFQIKHIYVTASSALVAARLVLLRAVLLRADSLQRGRCVRPLLRQGRSHGCRHFLLPSWEAFRFAGSSNTKMPWKW